MLIQKSIVEYPERRVVFTDSDLLIRWYRFGGCEKGWEITGLGKCNFCVFGDRQPLFVAELALTYIAGTDETPVTIVMLMGVGFSWLLFRFRFAAAVFSGHFRWCTLHVHHAEVYKLFCVQTGRNQKSHQQQKCRSFRKSLICVRIIFHKLRIQSLWMKPI